MIEKYAVLFKTTTDIPGDQRSIDYPGHGYGARTVEHNEYKEFDTREDFVKWVNEEESRKYSKLSYRAVKFIPVSITSTTTIDIG